MPSVIQVSDLRDGYVDVVRAVREKGRVTSPRGQPTSELLDVIIELENPRDALPIGVGRKLNRAIAYVEAAQLIGAVSRPKLMVQIAPQFERFIEPGGHQHAAYGNRIGRQVLSVVRKLRDDPDSRQAVITLWDRSLDNLPLKRDYACTVMLQFLIRDSKLLLHTTMRSNDTWLGLAFDIFQFCELQLTVARALGTEVGSCHHHAVSLHLYERDFEAADRLHYAKGGPVELHDGIGSAGMGWHELTTRAQMLLDEHSQLDDMTETERRYFKHLHKERA